MSPRLAIGPGAAPSWMADAVVDGGGVVVDAAEADGLVWGDPRGPDALAATLDGAPQLRWIQLPFAGIEKFVHLLDQERVWTCAKGVYAEPVAEMALTLGMAGLRGFGTYARAGSWEPPQGRNLLGGNVTILGGGGITESLVRMLGPMNCHITVVRRSDAPLAGVEVVLPADRYRDALPDADLVVVALALTPETEGIIAAAELQAMAEHAWLVNVARGRHVVTDDLVEALRANAIGGAGLDVTDPEPLPPGHPLWSMPNCLITPHVGNTPEMAVPLLSARITANVRRWAAGEELIGLVDVDAGY